MKDNVVLITGATGAVGQVVSRVVASTGARLALTGRRQDALGALAQELGHERVLAIAADLAREAEVEALIEAIAARWGGVDILLNIAGGWQGGERVAQVSLDQWEAGC